MVLKKLKILKFILPPMCIGTGIAIAAVIWLRAAGWTGNREDLPNPEDALQAALGRDQDPGSQDFTEEAVNAAILNETAMGKLPEALQKLREAASEMGAADIPASSAGDLPELPLRDLYGASGQTVRFHVCHPGAMDYSWEYYDMELREWLPAAGGSEMDALGRMTAYADFETPADQRELMLRCMYEAEDAGGQISEMAFLRALPQAIRQLELADESIEAEAGSCLAACDIAVKATYADGTSDVIDGLYGLYFMETEVEEESSETNIIDGILTERKVQAALNHFSPYRVVSAGGESITLAYISDAESPRLQLPGTITGTDEEPPVISRVDILAKEDIPGAEGERSVTMLVTAEDNVTPYPLLQYAVIEKDGEDSAGEAVDIGEITEEDWMDDPRITMILQGSSTWFLCSRDQAGNISVYGQQAPPGVPPAVAEEPEDAPDGQSDTQAPVIRNIYVEAD